MAGRNNDLVVHIISDASDVLKGYKEAISEIEKLANKAKPFNGMLDEIEAIKDALYTLKDDLEDISVGKVDTKQLDDVVEKSKKIATLLENVFKANPSLEAKVNDGSFKELYDFIEKIKTGFDEISKEMSSVDGENYVKSIFGNFSNEIADMKLQLESLFKSMSDIENRTLNISQTNVDTDSFVKETEEVKQALIQIEQSISKITALLRVVYNLPNDNDITAQWDIIEQKINHITRKDGELNQSRKNKIKEVAEEYQKYLNMGGTNPLESLGKSENVVNSLNEALRDLKNTQTNVANDSTVENLIKIDTSDIAQLEKAKGALQALNSLLKNKSGNNGQDVSNYIATLSNALSVMNKLDVSNIATIMSSLKGGKSVGNSLDNISSGLLTLKDSLNTFSDETKDVFASINGLLAKKDELANLATIFKVIENQINSISTINQAENAFAKVNQTFNNLGNQSDELKSKISALGTALGDLKNAKTNEESSMYYVNYSEMLTDVIEKLELQKNAEAQINVMYQKNSKAIDDYIAEESKYINLLDKQIDSKSTEEWSNREIIQLNKIAESSKKAKEALAELKQAYDKNLISKEKYEEQENKYNNNKYGSHDSIARFNDNSITHQNEVKNAIDGVTLSMEKLRKTSQMSIFQKAFSDGQTEITELNNKLKNSGISLKQYSDRVDEIQSEISSKKNTVTFIQPEDIDAGIAKMHELAGVISNNSAENIKLSNDNKSLTFTFTDLDGQLKKVRLSYKNITGAIDMVQVSSQKAKTNFEKFCDSMKRRYTEMIQYFMSIISVYEIWSWIKQGVTYITELDTALTEMRKVSDETTESLKSFQDVSFDIAKSIGTTAVALQSSTADWMRLGESIDEAAKSAEMTAVLMNVSEFDNISDATDALVSMSQAYKELDKITIIDKLNEVGNNYAISTDELATGLQKSAATLSLMGNTIDEAAAMITAANTTIQDVDSVANGLKTISLRLVGTKEAQEELESLGEEVDSYVTKTESKKQEIIKSYTAVASNGGQGFDILDDNGNYKDTFEILEGISKIYKEIQAEDKKFGTNRATALIEEMAGKYRSNILSALLSNGELLTAVKESSENAFGSAQKENEKYLDSIEGRLAKFQTQVQEFWYTLISSDFIKEAITLATDLLDVITQIIDKFGTGTIVTVIGSLVTLSKMKSSGWNFLANLLYDEKSGAITTSLLDALLKGVKAFPSAMAEVDVSINGTTKKVNLFSKAIVFLKNNLALLGVAAGVAVAAIAFDISYTSIEEYQEKIDGLIESIKTLQSEFDNLKSKNSAELTESEKERLRYLERKIELEKESLRLQNQEKNAKIFSDGIIDTMTSGNFINEKNSHTIETGAYDQTTGTSYTRFDEAEYQGLKVNAKLEEFQKLSDEITSLEEQQEILKKQGIEDLSIQDEINKKTQEQAEIEKEIITYQSKNISLLQDYSNLYEKYQTMADDPLNSEADQKKAQEAANFWKQGLYILEQISYKSRLLTGNDTSFDKKANTFLQNHNNVSYGDLRYNFSEEEIETLIKLNLPTDADIEETINALKTKIQNSTNDNPILLKASVSKSEVIDSLTSLSDGFDILDEIFADNKDGDVFDFSKLASDRFEKTFKELGVEYEDFIESIASSPNELSNTQDAYNKITTALIKQSGILENVDENNKNIITSYLELYGVTNAQELVNYELAKSNAEILLQEKFIIDSNGDLITTLVQVTDETGNLVNETDYEISKFIEAANASGTMSDALAMTLMEKILFSNTSLNTDTDIGNILALAEAAGYTSEVIVKLAQLKEDFENETDVKTKQWIGKTITEYTKQLQTEIAGWTPTNALYGGGKDSNKSSSSSKDKHLEEYKKKLSILEDELDSELITQRQFFDKSEALLNEYLKDSPEHMTKYAEEIAEAEKSLHDSWINSADSEIAYVEEKYNQGLISAEEYYQKLSAIANEYYGLQVENMDNIMLKMAQAEKQGNVDLFNRPIVSGSDMQKAGWADVAEDEQATLYSNMSFAQKADGSYVALHYTPILPDGTVLSPEQLSNYVNTVLQGSENMLASDYLGIVLNVEGVNVPQEELNEYLRTGITTPAIDAFLAQSSAWDMALHDLQEGYYHLGDAVNDYGRYTENIAELEKKINEIRKTSLDNAMSGVLTVIDKVINKYQKLQKAAEKNYDVQIEAFENQKDNIDDQIDAIDDQIKAIDKIIDTRQDEIDKIREVNDEINRQLDLQKAQYELEKAYSQKSIATYKDGQFVYDVDHSAIKDAKQNVKDKEEEIRIANLEKEIKILEERKESLEEQKELYEEQKEAIDKQIEAIEKMAESSSKYYDQILEKLDSYKSKWSDLASAEEDAKQITAMQEVLGKMGYTYQDITNMSADAFNDFKNKYVGYMAVMYAENDAMKQSLIDTFKLDDIAGIEELLLGTSDSLEELGNKDLSGTASSVDAVASSLGKTKDAADEASSAIAQGGGNSKEEGNGGQGKSQESGGSSVKSSVDEVYNTSAEKLPAISEMMDNIETSAFEATEQVSLLRTEIESLQDKTVTVTVNTVYTSSGGAGVNSSGIGSGIKFTNEKKAVGAKRINEEKGLWTQDGGQEFIVSPNNNAVYTIVGRGDSILTHTMTNNMWDWAKLNPSEVLGDMKQNIQVMPTVSSGSSAIPQSVYFNVSLPNVTNVTSANKLFTDLENIATKKIQFFNKKK